MRKIKLYKKPLESTYEDVVHILDQGTTPIKEYAQHLPNLQEEANYENTVV